MPTLLRQMGGLRRERAAHWWRGCERTHGLRADDHEHDHTVLPWKGVRFLGWQRRLIGRFRVPGPAALCGGGCHTPPETFWLPVRKFGRPLCPRRAGRMSGCTVNTSECESKPGPGWTPTGLGITPRSHRGLVDMVPLTSSACPSPRRSDAVQEAFTERSPDGRYARVRARSTRVMECVGWNRRAPPVSVVRLLRRWLFSPFPAGLWPLSRSRCSATPLTRNPICFLVCAAAARAPLTRARAARGPQWDVTLGTGAHKIIYKAWDSLDGRLVAWNVVPFKSLPAVEQRRLRSEVCILQKVRHRRLIAIESTWDLPDRVVFITPIVGTGDLQKYDTRCTRPSRGVAPVASVAASGASCATSPDRCPRCPCAGSSARTAA